MNSTNVFVLCADDIFFRLNIVNCNFKFNAIKKIEDLFFYYESCVVGALVIDYSELCSLDEVLHNKLYLFCKEKNISVIVIFDEINNASSFYCQKFNISDYFISPLCPLDLLNRIKMLFNKKNKLISNDVSLYSNSEVVCNNAHSANIEASDLESIKSNFLYMMSTELRNPLNGIVGFLDLLEFSIKNKTHLKYISYIKEASNKLIAISDLSMLLTSVKAGRYQAKNEIIYLKSILQELINSNKIDIKDKNLKLKIKAFPDDVNIFTDKKLLLLSLNQILSDAICNSPIKGEIYISIVSEDGSLNVEIRDQGLLVTNDKNNYTYTYFNKDSSSIKHDGRFIPGFLSVKELTGILNSNVELKNDLRGGVCVKLSLYKNIFVNNTMELEMMF